MEEAYKEVILREKMQYFVSMKSQNDQICKEKRIDPNIESLQCKDAQRAFWTRSRGLPVANFNTCIAPAATICRRPADRCLEPQGE